MIGWLIWGCAYSGGSDYSCGQPGVDVEPCCCFWFSTDSSVDVEFFVCVSVSRILRLIYDLTVPFQPLFLNWCFIHWLRLVLILKMLFLFVLLFLLMLMLNIDKEGWLHLIKWHLMFMLMSTFYCCQYCSSQCFWSLFLFLFLIMLMFMFNNGKKAGGTW